MYIVLSQKMKNSGYEDELFKTYHYPKKYKNNIHEGDIFVYQQGDRANPLKRFYYGTGRVGKITGNDVSGYYAELLDCREFDSVLPIKLPDVGYIETLGNEKQPAWQWSIRKLTDEAYKYIIDHAGMKPEIIPEEPDGNQVYDYGVRDSQNRLVKVRKRDSNVSVAVKKKAGGKCQLCGAAAPFTDQEGMPYLECHHVVWLADGGNDSVYNAVALCPNCHRKMHVLKLPEDIAKLKDIAANY